MTEESHELTFERLIDAPRSAVWRCWTEANLIKEWFTPRPWTTPVVEVDVRPGGVSRLVFRGPEGEEFPNQGVYLEVVPEERLVFTDAYTEAWQPSRKPFMTAIVTFAEEGGKTRYRARVRHWSAEDMAQHEAMGFHDGWGRAADQLEALARRI
ncbi:SRPBCC family protein [Aestuariivirga sp.]|uniref:SRPBCC family protein n=1 Tax=Aestuariivirga sp. TaxID=2650926 RepID=UPI00391A451F